MKHLIKNQYWEINKEYNKEKLLYLLIDRPTEIDCYDNFVWKNNKKQVHRGYDLPSYITENFWKNCCKWSMDGKTYKFRGGFLIS